MTEKEEKNDATDILMVSSILLIAIITTIIYLCYFIDCKNTNIIYMFSILLKYAYKKRAV